MRADIDNLKSASCFNFLNNLCDLIKNERPFDVLAKNNVAGEFRKNDHDPRITLQSAALKILEIMLDRMPDLSKKLDFLEQARKQPIFNQNFGDNLYYYAGLTSGEIAIDEMIAQLNTYWPCAIM
jgi:hypothetical protein